MTLEVVWVLTALIILATVFMGVSKGILGDIVLSRRGPRDFLLDCLARFIGSVFWNGTMASTLASTMVEFPNPIYNRIHATQRGLGLKRASRCGDPFTISLMGRTHTVIRSPETIKFVLSTAHASFPGGYSEHSFRLVSMEKFVDERHPHFRKTILPAASGDGLQKLVPFISSLAEKTVKS